MKRLIALMTATAFALSMTPNFGVAQTNPRAGKPKTECKCSKDCKGDPCKCDCHTAKKPERKEGE